MSFRKLHLEEIETLENQGCTAEDWSEIRVEDGFPPSHVQQVHFSGKVKIELQYPFNETIKDAGIYRSYIKDCVVANHVHISDVSYLSNYHIHEGAIVRNVGGLFVKGETSFGNGTEVSAWNEGGGREVVIYDKLTSQIAYLLATRRDDTAFIEKMTDLINGYIEKKKSEHGIIGAGSVIEHCSQIINVHVGPAANISGVNLLENCTIASIEEDPTFIGSGVTAKNSIVLSGSRVDSGVILEEVFVGQGCRLGKQFSAEQCLFFANCEGYHGEAVGLFAGPYTVTHHKSSLLIAALTSFYNAGSGTNQSNHMYKLGPIHQGVLERGSKTGSFSYMMWPCRVGAFSVVMGKNTANFDTSDFPFSYITEERGTSWLTPAMNLITVGTRRDTDKWPDRDRRKSDEKLDKINFNLFNPYIIERVIRGMDVLGELYEKTPKEREALNYKGIRIKRLLLKSCRKYYELAYKIFLGEMVFKGFDDFDKGLLREFKNTLIDYHAEDVEINWSDVGGMVSPNHLVAEFIESVRKGSYSDLEDLYNGMDGFCDTCYEFEWYYFIHLLRDRENLTGEEDGRETLTKIIEDWKESKKRLNQLILTDSKKEFDQNSRISFGLDGDNDTRDKDFESVRGSWEENSFVKLLQQEIEDIEKKAEELLAAI
ncbi:DUF4954 family protein [Bacteroidota bacterium]